MKEINGAWYSRKEWDLYAYRVKVRFNLIDGSDRSMDLYTSETDKHKIRVAINDTLNRDICATFEVECYTTREQDERTSEFLDEYFKLGETRPELEINASDLPESIADKVNSLDLRSDIENGNILDCVLRFSGYVGNRPSDCEDEEHEDDTWAIDVLNEDGEPVESYLYSSEYEYNQDYDLLKEYD
tara:strand:+ start:12864 stop:13421 length:558 start_codon:yes stop_codon:yes gene_type:complete